MLRLYCSAARICVAELSPALLPCDINGMCNAAPPKPIEEGPLSPSGRSGAGRATIDGGSILSGARGVQATVTLPALGTPGSSADEGPDPKVEEFMK